MPPIVADRPNHYFKPQNKLGRPKGRKNDVTRTIRWGLVEAYRQLGGVQGLVKWGSEKPDLFYPLLTKLIPSEMLEQGYGQPITVVIQRSQKPL